MNTSRFVVFLLILVSQNFLRAQNEVDALRYSFTQTPGTARSLGMGGAFGALGADNSSFWSNPGGIGLYRRGGIECSFGLSDMASSSLYEGEEGTNGRTNFTVQSLGLSSTRQISDSRWKSYTVGVAYGKTNNFYENISIRGTAGNTTLLDVFASQANGTEPASLSIDFPLGAGLAWDTYLINPLSETDLTYLPASDGGEVVQSKVMERKGALSETAFGGGANYMDWLYLGMSIGFHGITFSEKAVYREEFPESTDLSSYTFSENLRVTGTGIGMKLGAVARATKWLRLGAAWHSRISYGVTDNYSAELSSVFLNGDAYNADSPVNVANFNLRTPAKWLGSVAFILGESGVVTADYEYADFGSIRMNGTSMNNYRYETENETIRSIYRSTHRVRTGLEMRLATSWRLRTGAQYSQSPFAGGANGNTAQLNWAFGGGYRSDRFFTDLGINYLQRREDYYLYDPRVIESAVIDYSRLTVLLSGGFRF
jgi:hypothetical protein